MSSHRSSKPRRRIAVIGVRGVPATWGGVEHHCENLYSRLAEKGYDITIYGRNYYVPEDIELYKGMKIKRLPTLNFKYTDALLHTFFAMIHVLFTNPDIVHIHGIGPCFFSWLPRLFRPRMKVFFTCHGLDWQRKKWPWLASRLIYLGELCAVFFAQYRIVVSKDLQGYFQSVHDIATIYIPNGITPLPAREPELIKQWGLSARRYFLSVGRLVPEKRVEDVIKAFLVHPRASSLVIVGDNAASGQYTSGLLKLAEKKESSVIFTGYQFGDTLQELYSNALAFVTASELEGLPITLLEALSYGIICVTSNIPPHRELVEGLDAPSFAVGDIQSLSKYMDEVETMNAKVLAEFKQKAISMISATFSWDTTCGEHDRLYRNSLAE